MVFEARLIATRLVTKDDSQPLATKDALTAVQADVALLKRMMGVVLAGVASLILKTFF